MRRAPCGCNLKSKSVRNAHTLNTLRADGKFNKAFLCYITGNNAAKKLYESFGFAETERNEDEIVMELRLREEA